MKERFYVFLDIDGVLWDWKNVKNLFNRAIKPMGALPDATFNPESMQALNHLLNKLSDHYEPFLVITSKWRTELNETVNALYYNDLIFSGAIDSTSLLKGMPRGIEIQQYLLNHDNSKNYVVIDDSNTTGIPYFLDLDKFIKTSMFHALDKQQIDSYLNTLKPTEEEEPVLTKEKK